MNLRELTLKRNSLIEEMRNLLKENKIEEAEAKRKELRDLKAKISMLEEIEDDETLEAEGRTLDPKTEKVDPEKRYQEAFTRFLTRKNFTREDRNLLEQRALLGSVDADGGYLIPQDWRDKLHEFKRESKSMRHEVGYFATGVRSGLLPAEDISAGISGLSSLTEGDAITEHGAKFQQLAFTIEDYGAIIPISNTLLSDQGLGLRDYILRLFVKKSVITENTDIFAILTAKTVELQGVVSDYKSLGKQIILKIDPSLLPGAKIFTSQNGYAYLDDLEDGNGKPLLQTDHTNPAIKRFKGLPVEVYPETYLPLNVVTATTDERAPFLVGNMKEAAMYIDRQQPSVAASSEAGFENNTTKVRVIERFDVIELDSDAYFHAEINVLQ